MDHFLSLLPQLLELTEKHLKDTLSRYTEFLKEQGFLASSISLAVSGIKGEEEDPLLIHVDSVQ